MGKWIIQSICFSAAIVFGSKLTNRVLAFGLVIDKTPYLLSPMHFGLSNRLAFHEFPGDGASFNAKFSEMALTPDGRF